MLINYTMFFNITTLDPMVLQLIIVDIDKTFFFFLSGTV